jgi:hypothetical protein
MNHRSLASMLILLSACAVARAGETGRQEVTQSVERLAEEFSDGLAVAYPQFRHIFFGKMFNSKDDDAVAHFVLEGFHGGNATSEYLAFFAAVEQGESPRPKQHKYRLIAVRQVGARGWRSFDSSSMQLNSNGVELSGKAWAESDAGCCPSQTIRVNFAVQRGAVIELR